MVEKVLLLLKNISHHTCLAYLNFFYNPVARVDQTLLLTLHMQKKSNKNYRILQWTNLLVYIKLHVEGFLTTCLEIDNFSSTCQPTACCVLGLLE